MSIDRVVTPVELYRLPLRGAYEMGIISLVYKFGEKGLIMSNGKLATAFSTQKRTIEKVISRLIKGEFIRVKQTSNGKRCLAAGTALITVIDTALSTVGVPPLDTQTTALSDDHKEEGNKEREGEATVGAMTTDFQAAWNSHKNLPCILTMTQARIHQLATRLQEPDFADNWREIIARISESSFCTGHNDRGWKADVDWLLKNDRNYVKVLEGKYDNAGPVEGGSGHHASQTEVDLNRLTHEATEEDLQKLAEQGIEI